MLTREGLLMRVSDEQLANWTRPAFSNEEQRANDTEVAIRRAINNHKPLSNMNLRVLPKGSIKNNTNVRRDSDIDIAIVNQSHITIEYTGGGTMEHAGLVPYTGISAQDYKTHVGEAMRKEFGVSNIDSSGNRVFRIRGSDRVMNADVIPSTQYWLVAPGWQRKGIALILDYPDGKVHYNYPDHHFDNGVEKNNRTGRRYKRAVRILKNIENKLVAEGTIKPFPSFLIECMAYNVPDYIYTAKTDWRNLICDICIHFWSYLSNDVEPANDDLRWSEVNGHKYLFGNHQRWTKQEAKDFTLQVYDMVTE